VQDPIIDKKLAADTSIKPIIKVYLDLDKTALVGKLLADNAKMDLKLRIEDLNRKKDEIIRQILADQQRKNEVDLKKIFFKGDTKDYLAGFAKLYNNQNVNNRNILEFINRHDEDAWQPENEWEDVPDHVFGQPETVSQVNTHTASVHKSVSESILRLVEKYKVQDFTDSMVAQVVVLLDDPRTEAALNLRLEASNEDGVVFPEYAQIKALILAGISYIQAETYMDPVSQVTLQDLFKSILVGINSLDAETKLEACLSLCEFIYLLKTEYVTTKSCESGFVNGLVYSQQSTLPNEVNVVIQKMAFAGLALKYKIVNHAERVYNENSSKFNNAEDFTAAVMQLDFAQCLEIVRELVSDYHTLFGLEADVDCREIPVEVMEVYSLKLTGGPIKDLLESVPVDFAKLYAGLSSAKADAKPRMAPTVA
jgi:hypothetical protein